MNSPITCQTWFETPLGPLLAARRASGLAGLWFADQKDAPAPLDAPERPDDELLARVGQLLQRYFETPASIETELAQLPMALEGTPFQLAVWQALRSIEPGQTRRYGELATELAPVLGHATAARAVGTAVGRNPVSIFIPCHRVIGSGGALTGYAGGLHRKVALLTLEGAAFRPLNA